MHPSKLPLTLCWLAVLLALPSCMQTTNQINNSEDEMSTVSRSDSSQGKIKLFIYPSCPYCKKVISYLNSTGNSQNVEVLDANDPRIFTALKKLNNGNTQCPFIYDEKNNVKMLESQDIMDYFQKIFAA